MWTFLLPAGAVWLGGLAVVLALAVWDQTTPTEPAKPTQPATYCPVCQCIIDEHRRPQRWWWWWKQARRRGGPQQVPQVCAHHLRVLQLCYQTDHERAVAMSGFMRLAGRRGEDLRA